MNLHKVTRPFWVNAAIGVAVEGQEVPIEDPIRARQLMLSGLIEDNRSEAELAEDAVRHGRVVGIAPRAVSTDPISPPADTPPNDAPPAADPAAAVEAPQAPAAGPDAAQAAAGAPETAAVQGPARRPRGGAR